MIERKIVNDLARKHDIDEYSILREYIQLTFLRDLYQTIGSAGVFFKGGTSIHLLLHSFRFSEDLNFTVEISKAEVKDIIRLTTEKVRHEAPGLESEFIAEDGRSISHRLSFPTELSIRPLTIRIEMSMREKPLTRRTSVIETEFPVMPNPLVVHFDFEEILAEKVRAIMTRNQGRDLFDLWFLFSKNVALNEGYIKEKMRYYRKEYKRTELIKKVVDMPEGLLRDDLEKFLPKRYRQMIAGLKTAVTDKLSALTLKPA